MLPEQPSRQTRSACLNDDLTQYQRQLQQLLGLRSFGFFSCAPDGNCGFSAVSQLLCTQGRTVNSLLDLPCESQARQAELRQATANELRNNTELQKALCQQESSILHTWPELQPERHAAIPVWELLARGVLPASGMHTTIPAVYVVLLAMLVSVFQLQRGVTCDLCMCTGHAHGQMSCLMQVNVVSQCIWSDVVQPLCPGGLWAGDWLMKALAIVTRHNIITLAPSSLCLHSCHAPHEQHGYGIAAMKPYPASYAKLQRDLPLEALDEDTWYLIYDGLNHYWPAVRAGHAPSQADVQQANLVLNMGSSKPIIDAVSKHRRVRIRRAT